MRLAGDLQESAGGSGGPPGAPVVLSPQRAIGVPQPSRVREPRRTSTIRLASVTISSLRLFSRLEGLSANALLEPGGKIVALQPFPTGLTSIRIPLYSRVVIISLVTVFARQPPKVLEPGRRKLSVARHVLDFAVPCFTHDFELVDLSLLAQRA